MKRFGVSARWALAFVGCAAMLTGCGGGGGSSSSGGGGSQAPTVTSFTATAAEILAGSSTTLTAVFSGGTGVVTPGNLTIVSGTPLTVTPTVTTTYTITVTATGGGSTTQTVTVKVDPAPAIASFSAGAAEIQAGSSTTLTAVFSGGTGVVTPGNLTILSGTPLSVTPTATTTYTITVTPPVGTAITQQVTVIVDPVITSFTASANPIVYGSSTDLTAVFNGGIGVITPGNLTVTSGAPVTVTPATTTTYTLTVTPSAGSATTAVRAFATSGESQATLLTGSAASSARPSFALYPHALGFFAGSAFAAPPGANTWTNHLGSLTVSGTAGSGTLTVNSVNSGVISDYAGSTDWAALLTYADGSTQIVSVAASSVGGNSLTIYPTLRSNLAKGTLNNLYGSVNGQHLSTVGFSAFAQWLYGLKKYQGYIQQAEAYRLSDGSGNFTGTPMTLIGGLVQGGYLPETNPAIARGQFESCSQTEGSLLGSNAITDPNKTSVNGLPCATVVGAASAGQGVQLASSQNGLEGLSGYFHAFVAVTGQYGTTPASELTATVTVDGVAVCQNKAISGLVELTCPFTNGKKGTFSVSLNSSAPTVFKVSAPAFYVWQPSLNAAMNDPMISPAANTFTLMDSWGQMYGYAFPTALEALLANNPAGASTGFGDYSLGGQTAIWGTSNYASQVQPKHPDYMVTNFQINDLNSGLINGYAISAGGNYSAPPTVTISGCTGTPPSATAVLTGSAVTGLVFANVGSGCTSPTVQFSPAGATAILTVSPSSPSYLVSSIGALNNLALADGTIPIYLGSLGTASYSQAYSNAKIEQQFNTVTSALSPSTPGGPVTKSLTVTVLSSAAITNFYANPTSIQGGSSTSLYAYFTGGTGVITPGNLPVTSGTPVSVSPGTTTTYTLTVTPTGGGTAITKTATVSVYSITSFTANPNPIVTGSSTQLTAVFAGGTAVVTPGNVAVTSGTPITVNPALTTTYTLTVTPTTGTPITQALTVNVEPTITVDLSSKGPAVTDQLMGMNMAAWYDIDANKAAINTAFQAAGIKALRWPGGSQSDIYHWQTNSVCSAYGGYAVPNSNYLNFINDLEIPGGYDIALTANYGTNATCNGGGDPTEAANWVAYAYANGGIVSHVTVGNESYGSWEVDLHAKQHDPATYAAAVTGASGYYALIKAQSANTKVGVVVEPNVSGWDSTVLANAKGSYDFVEYHFYPQNPGQENDTTLVQQAAQTLTANIKKIQTELQTVGESNIPIYVGEIGSVSSNPGKQSWSITQGLYAGQVLGEFLNDGIARATWWIGFGNCNGNNGNMSSSLYGWQNFGAYNVFADGSGDTGGTNNSPCSYGGPIGTMSPTAQAYNLFQQVAVAGEFALAPPTVAGDTTSVRAYAATHSGGTALVLFNLNQTTPETVVVTLSGGAASSPDVTMETYDKSMYDQSKTGTWATPAVQDLGAQNLPLTLTLTPWSMNVVLVK